MATTLKVRSRIIKIGNSQGIRIPRCSLGQLQLGEEVEIEARQDQLVIRRARRPRQGWDEQFRAMAEQGDDQPLGPLVL